LVILQFDGNRLFKEVVETFYYLFEKAVAVKPKENQWFLMVC